MKKAKRSSSTSKRKASTSAKRKSTPDTRANPNQSIVKPEVNLMPDSATDALKTLSKKKLSDEPNIINQTIDASNHKEKAGQLAAEYLNKMQSFKANVSNSLNQKVVRMEIPQKLQSVKQDQKLENVSMFDLKQNKLADGFVRSERNVAMRTRDHIEQQIDDLRGGKDELLEKLNKKIMQLDKLNANKRELHEKLAEQIQFVRDLEKALNGASTGDLNTLVTSEVREEFKREKALHKLLEEQLLIADKERCRLQERIKLLAGEKTEVIVFQNGQKKSYQVTSSTVDQLSREIQSYSTQIRHQEQAITASHETQIKYLHEIQAIEHKIKHLKNERAMLLEKTNQIEMKQEHAMRCLGTESHRANHLHHMHQKLLSIKIMEYSIEKLVRKSQQQAFQQLWKVANDERTAFLLQKSIQDVFRTIYFKKVRTAMQKWYSAIFAPVKAIKVDRKLPKFMQDLDQESNRQMKWTIKYDLDQQREFKKEESVRKILHITRQFEDRLKEWSTQIWIKNVFYKNIKPILQQEEDTQQHNIKTALFKVKRILIKQQIRGVGKRFHHWRNESVQTLTNFKLLALSKAFAVQHINSKIFTEWKINVSKIKTKKRSMIVRAFKNFKANWVRSKSFIQKEQLVDKLVLNAQYSILEQCYDQLKSFKQRKILKRSKQQEIEVLGETNQLNRDIENISGKMNNQELVRAFNALVIAPFKKQIAQVLQIWSMNAQVKHRQLNDDLKNLVIKSYMNKLRIGFNRFKVGLKYLNKSNQHINVDQIHDKNFDMQQQQLILVREIAIHSDKVRELGFKHFKYLCKHLQLKRCNNWMQRWLRNCKIIQKKQTSAELILNKIRKLILRQYLAKYKNGCSMLLQDIYNARKTEEIKHRLAFRTKQRIFYAIREFARVHYERKISMRHLIRSIERHNQSKGIRCWKYFTSKCRDQSNKVSEKNEVNKIEDLQTALCLNADVKNYSEIVNKKYLAVLKTLASETIKKWVSRFHLGGQQYGFITWKNKTAKIRHRSQLLQNIRRALVVNNCAASFFRWKQTMRLEVFTKIEEIIEQQGKTVENQTNKIQYNKQVHKKEVNTIGKKLEVVQGEKTFWTKRAVKSVEAFIQRRLHNVFLNRQRYLFNYWRNYAKNQHKFVRALQNGITKMFLQKGFCEIRDYSRAEVRQDSVMKHAKNLVKIKLQNSARLAINKWYTILHNTVRDITNEVKEQASEVRKVHSEYLDQIIKQRVDIYEKSRDLKVLQQKLELWRRYAYICKTNKQNQKQTFDAAQNYLIKKALQKLSQRAKVTIKTKKICEQIKNKLNRRTLQLCYVQGLKFIFKNESGLSFAVRRIVKSMVFLRRKIAFQRIKHFSEIKYEATCRMKEYGGYHITELLQKLVNRRLRESLRLIQKNNHENRTLFIKLKQCFNSRAGIYFRSFFIKWKQQTKKEQVVEFINSEDGPLNVSVWNERIRCQNLMQQMQEGGYTRQQTQEFLEKSKERFNYLVEKTICRMMVYPDPNLSLLPYALDRLRFYTKTRKLWREKIELCDGFINKSQNNLYVSFLRWRRHFPNKRVELQQIAYQELTQREDENKKKLVKFADEIDYHNKAIEDLQEQRGVLFKCFIGSQKLALSNTKNIYQRSQQKSIIRLSDYGNNNLQGQIGNAIDKNLEIIQSLKERIGHFEHDNHQISAQNDQFRGDAIQAIHNARQVEFLKQEIERMQRQIAESATTMKNLLADNHVLSRHLQDARVDAKIQLEHTSSLQNQKMIELERLKLAERLTSSRRQNSLRTQQQSQYREQERSTSPQIQESSFQQRSKSPLRMKAVSPQIFS